MTSRAEYNNPQGLGKLGLPYQYEMISDPSRVLPFKMAINKSCKGKVVFESGTGSGIMSILAARAGAKRVYATEIDPDMANFARENINKNKLQNIIKVIQKDTRKVTLDDLDGERVDVVIAENLSTWEVMEPEISILNHINEYLINEEGIRIPETIYNYFELAYSKYNFEDGIELRTYYFEFSGIKEPEIFSDRIIFEEINLSKINPLENKKSITAKVNKNGIVNSVRLTSPLKLFNNITFNSSDSLMPPVIFPLQKDINCISRDKLSLTFKYSFEKGWENFYCQAEKI